MKKIFGFFAILAVSLLGIISCQKEVEQVEKPATSHTLKFVADIPLAKTTAVIDQTNKTVDYKWTEADEDRFTVYEIVQGEYKAAKETIGNLNDDGTMSLLASFNGSFVPGAQYVALLNNGVQANQNATGIAYDELSDVLISEKVTSENVEEQELKLGFRRETAFALMTAKGLNDGANIIGASLTSGQILAAEYDIEKEAFKEEGAKTISIYNDGKSVSTIEGGNGNIFFAAAPITDAHITVGVVTGDTEGKFVAAYEKKIADDRSISFESGNVRPFNIGMNKVTEQALNLTIDETTTATENELSWDRTFVKVVAAKANASTNANNYYPGVDSRTSTRFYKNSTLTFTQKLNVPIKKIEFSATSTNYANALKGSNWTNAKSSVSEKTVSVIPIDVYAPISATIGETCGFESIVITYGEPEPATPHSVIISDTIENGEVSATPTSAIIGTEITLTATPATGYEFGTWSVTNASTSEAIIVQGDKFTMPDADVNVSATFKKFVVKKITTMSAEANADIKFIKGASSAEGAVWVTSTPLTVNNITLSGSVTSGSNYSYYDDSVVRFYTNNNLVITPSNDAVITKIEIVRQTTTGSNGGKINCNGLTASGDNTTTNTNVFTGESSTAVTFTASAQARFTKIIVYATPGKTINSVTVTGDVEKKSYKGGDDLDTSGLIATATYDDASTKDVTDEVEWTVTPTPLTVGTTSVSVVATYKGVSSDAKEITGITVTEPATLESITVKTAPTTVEYIKGEKFDPAGLVITRNYSDAPSDEYAYAGNESDFTFAPTLETALTTDHNKVTITYKGKSVDQAITVTSIANTKETAYTVSEARALIDAGKDLDTEVYVKGKISEIVTAYSSDYGNISFNISANGRKDGDQFQFYRNFKGADKTKWTDSDTKPAVGNEVIGFGKLTKYGSTYEFAEGNYIVSITEAPYLNASATKTSGIAADGEEITINVETNIDSWEAVSSDDTNFKVGTKTATSFKVTVAKNTDTEKDRTATITVSAEGVDDVVITLTQSKVGGVTVTWVAKDASDNPGDGNNWLSGSIDTNISWSATKGGSNDPKYYSNGEGLRIYNGGTFTVSATNNKKITKIVLTFQSSSYTFSGTDTTTPQTYELSSVSSKNWSVSRTCRLQKVEVTYE